MTNEPTTKGATTMTKDPFDNAETRRIDAEIDKRIKRINRLTAEIMALDAKLKKAAINEMLGHPTCAECD